MALMLRYLGIPSRVGAGFTSGTLRPGGRRWTVDRPRRAHVGRGLVPRLRLAAVRPDARARRARRLVQRGVGRLQPQRGERRDRRARRHRRVKLDFGRVDRGEHRRRPAAATSRATSPDRAGGGSQGSLLRLLARAARAGCGGDRAAEARAPPRAVPDARPAPKVAAACRRELADFLADQRARRPRAARRSTSSARSSGSRRRRPAPFVDAVEDGPLRPTGRRRAARRARPPRAPPARAALRRRLSPWDRARGWLSVRSLGLT